MTPRNESELQFDTRSIHAGRHPEYSSPPIYLSATGARGYTRGGNQTISAMEQAVSALEGGKHAVACACGMAAVTQTLLALLKAGDHVVCHRSVYDWTDWWLRDALGGIAVANDKAIHQKVCRSRSLQGGVISPFNAFLIMRGMETLSMRMDQHCANAVKVARFLAGHPAVGEVRYPGLPDDSGYELACEILPDGCGGLVGFTIRGGQAALDRFKAALKLVRPWVSLGDTGSLVYGRHPEPRKGIPEGFARLSVGLEAVEDITADLKQALDKAYRAIQ